jgi:hypothetical protein
LLPIAFSGSFDCVVACAPTPLRMTLGGGVFGQDDRVGENRSKLTLV